jgi:hypothetical protein
LKPPEQNSWVPHWIITITVDKCISKTQSIRKFSKFSISQFAINLSYENFKLPCSNMKYTTPKEVEKLSMNKIIKLSWI